MSEGGGVKKPKVGADGLTKKERKALKSKKNEGENKNEQKQVQGEVKTNEVALKNENLTKEGQEKQETNAGSGQGGGENKEGAKTKAELKAERRAQIEKELALKKQENAEEGHLSKAELKAQRRALQEKQREAKNNQVGTNSKTTDKTVDKTIKKALIKTNEKEGLGKTNEKAGLGKTNEKVGLGKTNEKEAALNKQKKQPIKLIKNKHPHFEMIEHMTYKSPVEDFKTIRDDIHPSFSELGVKTALKTVKGANARSIALIYALKNFVGDFKSPQNQEFCRSLENNLQVSVDFLGRCRPLSAGMSNIVRSFKMKLTKVDKNLSDVEKKDELTLFLELYLENEIEKASEAISMKTRDKITNGDVILTYGCSSLVEKILLDAKSSGKEFSVIIADSKPFTEGRILLARLLQKKINCSFILINAISSVMSKVSKVLLGAHSLLSNGFVMSRIGTGQIAMIAKDFHKPVLICCETYKFCERVQTDSYVTNEIGDANLLEKISFTEDKNSLKGWTSADNVIPMHLVYDVASPDVVTAVITELGTLPCTSVPVVLRYKLTEM